MSRPQVKVRLANAIRPDLSPVEVEAVADSEQPYLLLPETLAARLALDEVDVRNVLLKDGEYGTRPYVGPILVQLGDECCYTGAVIDGSHVRIGFIALASMNLAVEPCTGNVVPNPAGPPRVPTVFLRPDDF